MTRTTVPAKLTDAARPWLAVACALVIWSAAVEAARAQSDAARGADAKAAASKPAAPAPSPSPPPADARALYEDAEKFLERKFAEYERGRVPFSRALEAEARAEQRALAERNAARLAGSKLKGADHFYLTLLYEIAGKPALLVESARRFIAEAGPNDRGMLFRAHHLLVLRLVDLGRLEEAERAFSEFARASAEFERQYAGLKRSLFNLRMAFARGYDRAGKLDAAAAHAAEALRVARAAEADGRAAIQHSLDFHSAARLHADILLRAKRDADALAVMKELLSFGLSHPSAHIYDSAKTLLTRNGHAAVVNGSLADSARHTATAPEIEVAEWVGEPAGSLASLRGRVVLLDFWATWCGPCRLTMPKLGRLHERYGGRGLTIIGVTHARGAGLAGQPESAEMRGVRDFKAEMKIPYAFAVAADARNDLRYGVRAIPTAVLIDRRGRVRHIAVGSIAGSDEVLGKMIERLLDEKP